MSAESWDAGQELADAVASDQASSRAFIVVTASDAKQLLESEAIHWRRDWDALVVGFLAGALSVLAVQGLW